ncbi:MAG: hypothetical protein HYT48_00700 [Candidatus Vogelbacteria bacterium]|nr:hypothetical protein [Candidatus Vogelbacteria bacterium]
MVKNEIIKPALINAALTALYIVLIASFLFYAPDFVGKKQPDTVLMPIVMLSLFVFSAALTGFLMLGRPVLWYWDGKKKEAVSLLAYTLGIFLVFTVIVLLALYLSV